VNWRTGRGRRAEGLAEGLLLGDERTLTECNATSQFDPERTSADSKHTVPNPTYIQVRHRRFPTYQGIL
jgi:hypothetical protein